MTLAEKLAEIHNNCLEGMALEKKNEGPRTVFTDDASETTRRVVTLRDVVSRGHEGYKFWNNPPAVETPNGLRITFKTELAALQFVHDRLWQDGLSSLYAGDCCETCGARCWGHRVGGDVFLRMEE